MSRGCGQVTKCLLATHGLLFLCLCLLSLLLDAGPTLTQRDLTYTCKELYSKEGHIPRFWVDISWGGTIQPTSAVKLIGLCTGETEWRGSLVPWGQGGTRRA